MAVAEVKDEQEMEEVPATEQPGFPRQDNVINRADPKIWLVPYVSLSSDEEEDDSDDDGMFFLLSMLFFKKVFNFSRVRR